MKPPRVVSLLPSATEIVARLGAESWLVGRSEECDSPASVLTLPVVMRARTLDRDQPSGEIDARVRATRQQNQSLYALDLVALRTLRPDVIFTQDLCGVCSVTESEVTSACRDSGVTPRIVSLSPRSLDSVWDSVVQVGDALQLSDRGRALADELRRRAAKTGPSSGARVVVVEWLDPPFVAGLWAPDMIAAAGGIPVGTTSTSEGLRSTWAHVRDLRPDLVIVSPCSFPVSRTVTELHESPAGEKLGQMRPSLGTWLVDEAYFSRPGPRLAEGVELIRALLGGEEPAHPLMPVRRWEPPPRGTTGEN
ncbi:MAG: cobalamin-binding protein [Thermoplasmata archaeon]